ncbi:MAG: hypothetical protein HY690_12890 [Chloroflexi bacterium]|nr:hypothetical protein [Chloroflexota bacterium]
MSDPSCASIRDQLARANVKLVASLPDDWVSPLIQAIDRDSRFMHVPVAREAEIVGICAGAFFAGVNAAAVMGMAGVLASAHELATLNLMHGIPLLILTSLRGQLTDYRVYQVIQGQVGIPVLDALGIPHWAIERPDQLDEVAQAVEHSRIIKKPAALCFTREMLR